ncbi:MAG: phosphomannomutase/phosphoglucomutase [Proteobacteria bacterium]|nr:phosphomannomutase/phosphoglucomutase [Pseudomonadota bacterium]
MPVNPIIFRAYDIRGLVDTDLTPDCVQRIGCALGALYPHTPPVVIARDGRRSSRALAEALGAGLADSGRSVVDIGEVPTPVLYYATHVLETGAGVMVTGSHNPPEYNGLKIMMDGKTLFGEALQAICRYIQEGPARAPEGQRRKDAVLERYLDEVCAGIRLSRPLRIAIDCGNGVAGPAAVALFSRLGCEVESLYCEVDGDFPNHHPDPSVPENLRDLIDCVRQGQLDLGLAFDGDGDRLGVVDERGRVLWPDRQMMLYSRDVLSQRPGGRVVFDVKCSKNLRSVIEQAGGEAVMWKTGHSLIKDKMAETDAVLGGEMSGHVFFKDRWYGFDDALYSAARLLEILSKERLAASQLFDTLPDDICTPEIVVRLGQDGDQHTFMEAFGQQVHLPGAQVLTIDGVRAEYATGWGLVRASNTTPALVLRFEARDEAALQDVQAAFRAQLLRVDAGLELPF